MSSVVKGLFGGTDDSAQQAQQSANAATQRFIEQQAGQAREDVLGLFPAAQQQRQASFQQALDVLGGALPQQADLFAQGNVGAQQVLLGGMDPFRQAIMGMTPDMSGLQAQRFTPNFSFIPTHLAGVGEAGAGVPAQQTQPVGAVGPGGFGGPAVEPGGFSGFLGGIPDLDRFQRRFGNVPMQFMR